MPIYEYKTKEAENGCKHCAEGFEVTQRITEEPLRACPKCGTPVKRVISLFSVASRPSARSLLSDTNIKRHGFTKLVNEGDGKFRKI